MNRLQLVLLFILIMVASLGCQTQQEHKHQVFDPRVEPLLKKMTLDEKLGQLNQISNPYLSTGTGEQLAHNENIDEMIRQGQIGSFLNVLGAQETLRLQKIAVEESRLGIPLLFAFDVIHGYKTMFPIPLGETASFDREAMERSARIAAIEASANGLHWTFAPMIDVSRDPRWGRIMEGAGEDVYLNNQAAIARVRGFQGNDLAAHNTIAACAKHFVAYGASMGGRDYHMVELSERMLREVYFPPFQAAIDAGVVTFMSAFNTIGGVPASADRWLFTDVLRNEWGFEGLVVSDWTSITELIHHGVAQSGYDAAWYGINAGIDMDMMGSLYLDYGKQLIEAKKISEKQIDQMVRRVLNVKFKLGLFDNPFQYSDSLRQAELTLHPDHLAASRDIARRSIVLLKNENNILPLSKDTRRIAVIGPLANDKDAPIGNWRASADPHSAVSLLEGIRQAVGNRAEVLYSQGCRLILNENTNFFSQLVYNTTDRSGFAHAIATAKRADVVIMALGETAYQSGECRSYADISLKGLQLELLREIRKTGKPIILALFTGRPLVLTDVVEHTDAILNCWLLGSESGNAIADVIFGDYNPSGKLPVSFPYHVGQIPVFYEQLNTGRPFNPNPEGFSTKYRDIPNEPLFAFGYGLSYTSFEYSNLVLSHDTMKMNGSITVRATVSNTGNHHGEEVVQLYIRDVVGNGVARPLLQLKGFEKIMLEKGTSKEVSFEIKPADLAFFRLDKTFAPEPGKFEVFVGTASNNLALKGEFELID